MPVRARFLPIYSYSVGGTLQVRHNGTWKTRTGFHVRVSGAWVVGTPYLRRNGTWIAI